MEDVNLILPLFRRILPTMGPPIPDWQLPAGVTRGLWEYLHDHAVARGYDASLAGSTLLTVDRLFAQTFFDRPGRLLDLGCGTGRLLVPFARLGCWVLGVDLSEEMLKQAGERAAREGVTIQRLKANIVDLRGLRDQSFDYVACLFSTLGMIDGAEHRQRVLDHTYRLLRPGGCFVLHVHNRWFNFWDPEGRRWLVRDLLRSFLKRTPGGDRLMPVHQGIAGLTLHLFTRREAERMLKQAGFRLLQVRPVSLRPDGRLPWPGCFGWLRSYGYLVAAERR
jgi:ubiquinone/menaquinone biosynthesis C-methylase UbiE